MGKNHRWWSYAVLIVLLASTHFFLASNTARTRKKIPVPVAVPESKDAEQQTPETPSSVFRVSLSWKFKNSKPALSFHPRKSGIHQGECIGEWDKRIWFYKGDSYSAEAFFSELRPEIDEGTNRFFARASIPLDNQSKSYKNHERDIETHSNYANLCWSHLRIAWLQYVQRQQSSSSQAASPEALRCTESPRRTEREDLAPLCHKIDDVHQFMKTMNPLMKELRDRSCEIQKLKSESDRLYNEGEEWRKKCVDAQKKLIIATNKLKNAEIRERRKDETMKERNCNNRSRKKFGKVGPRQQQRVQKEIAKEATIRTGGDMITFLKRWLFNYEEVLEDVREDQNRRRDVEVSKAARKVETNPDRAMRLAVSAAVSLQSFGQQQTDREAGCYRETLTGRMERLLIPGTGVIQMLAKPSKYMYYKGRERFDDLHPWMKWEEMVIDGSPVVGAGRVNPAAYVSGFMKTVMESVYYEGKLKNGIPDRMRLLEAEANDEKLIEITDVMVLRIGSDKFPWRKMRVNGGTAVTGKPDMFETGENKPTSLGLLDLMPCDDKGKFALTEYKRLYASLHEIGLIVSTMAGRVVVQFSRLVCEMIIDGAVEHVYYGTGNMNSHRPLSSTHIRKVGGARLFPTLKTWAKYAGCPSVHTRDMPAARGLALEQYLDSFGCDVIIFTFQSDAEKWAREVQLGFEQNVKQESWSEQKCHEEILKYADLLGFPWINDPFPGAYSHPRMIEAPQPEVVPAVEANPEHEAVPIVNTTTSVENLHLGLRVDHSTMEYVAEDVRDVFSKDPGYDEEKLQVQLSVNPDLTKWEKQRIEQMNSERRMHFSFNGGPCRRAIRAMPVVIKVLYDMVEDEFSICLLAFHLWHSSTTCRVFSLFSKRRFNGVDDPDMIELQRGARCINTVLYLWDKTRSYLLSRVKLCVVSIPKLMEQVYYDDKGRGVLAASANGHELFQKDLKSVMNALSCPSSRTQVVSIAKIADLRKEGALEQNLIRADPVPRKRKDEDEKKMDDHDDDGKELELNDIDDDADDEELLSAKLTSLNEPCWTPGDQTMLDSDLSNFYGPDFVQFYRAFEAIPPDATALPPILENMKRSRDYEAYFERDLKEMTLEEKAEYGDLFDLDEEFDVEEIFERNLDVEAVVAAIDSGSLARKKKSSRSRQEKTKKKKKKSATATHKKKSRSTGAKRHLPQSGNRDNKRRRTTRKRTDARNRGFNVPSLNPGDL